MTRVSFKTQSCLYKSFDLVLRREKQLQRYVQKDKLRGMAGWGVIQTDHLFSFYIESIKNFKLLSTVQTRSKSIWGGGI